MSVGATRPRRALASLLAVLVVLAVAALGVGCSRGGKGTSNGKPRRFLRPPWYIDISKAKLHPKSASMIQWLHDQGSWGTKKFQIDLSIHVLTAKRNTPMRKFEINTDEFYSPDCDHVPVPVPVGGAIEGEKGYHCVTDKDGDCHLIVFHPFKKKLYEMWRANIKPDGTFIGGCLAVWDLTKPYKPEGRGHGCTSADAAGLPIAPLLFTADELHAGRIKHALRFILPNWYIRGGIYLTPATHSTPAASGGPRAIPYGARFRLRADYPVDKLPSKGAKVIARALQKYGMFLADAGLLPLTGRSDRYTKGKYAGILGTNDMNPIRAKDFEVIDADVYQYNRNCNRAD